MHNQSIHILLRLIHFSFCRSFSVVKVKRHVERVDERKSTKLLMTSILLFSFSSSLSSALINCLSTITITAVIITVVRIRISQQAIQKLRRTATEQTVEQLERLRHFDAIDSERVRINGDRIRDGLRSKSKSFSEAN